MNSRLPATLCVLLLAAAPSWAQATGHEGHEGHGAAAPVTSAAAVLVNGEVRKVDASANRITLSHDAIPNLGMPKMTMVFAVKEPAMLKQVKAGDKVRFAADRIGGELTVVGLQAAK